MPFLYRYGKVTCDKCGNQFTKFNLARHKKSCSAGTLYWTQCPNFSSKSQIDLNYHIAKNHRPQKFMRFSSVNFVIKSFQDFTLYVIKEALNMECKSDQGQETWMWNT